METVTAEILTREAGPAKRCSECGRDLRPREINCCGYCQADADDRRYGGEPVPDDVLEERQAIAEIYHRRAKVERLRAVLIDELLTDHVEYPDSECDTLTEADFAALGRALGHEANALLDAGGAA